jgi:hypothetical protein
MSVAVRTEISSSHPPAPLPTDEEVAEFTPSCGCAEFKAAGRCKHLPFAGGNDADDNATEVEEKGTPTDIGIATEHDLDDDLP